MTLKTLSLLGLLAAVPMASQAAMVEMNETELSDVNGQASITIPGLLMSRTIGFGVENEFSPPDYERVYTDVPGGVKRVSTFETSDKVTPYFSYTSTGNFTGNPYRIVDSETPFYIWKVDYSRTRTHFGFNPDR